MLASGLARFARLWRALQGRLVSRRLEGALGRLLACESMEGERVLVRLSRLDAELDSSDSPDIAHGTLRLAEGD